jgi:hypothetical protein
LCFAASREQAMADFKAAWEARSLSVRPETS